MRYANAAPTLSSTQWNNRESEVAASGSQKFRVDDPVVNVSGHNLSPCGRWWPSLSVAHALLRAASPLLATPLDSRPPEAATRAGVDSCRERLWRHKPHRMVVDSGGARTPACRVGTPADTRNFCDPEASARVSLRHARVRAPRQAPALLGSWAGVCSKNQHGKLAMQAELDK